MTMACPKLQVLIVTYGRRIDAIDLAGLPIVGGVEYIVSCQNPDRLDLDTSRFDGRDDIKVYFFADRGVSRNRNHCLDIATADYVQISDDDIAYNADALVKLIETFDADNDIDIVTTRSVIPEHHEYPLDRHDLAKPWRFYSPIAFEIALRRSAVVKYHLRFAERISIGTDYVTAGEENFFFLRCMRCGLYGVFRNITLSEHRGPTTCSHSAQQPGVVRAKGAILPCARGYFGGLIRLPVEAWRSQLPFFKALTYLVQGYLYYLKYHKEL